MGKIKATILPKKDRPVTESKPPSMRRQKRLLSRGTERQLAASNTFIQVVPETAVFRFKKTKRPTKIAINEHYSDGKADKITESRLKFESCSTDDSAAMARFELMAEEKLGKIEIKKRKVIRHRIDKQDGNFKFQKHDIKF